MAREAIEEPIDVEGSMSPHKSGMPPSSYDYQAEDDHRTMMRAAEIESDKKRLGGVKKHHRSMGKKMALVQRRMTGMSR